MTPQVTFTEGPSMVTPVPDPFIAMMVLGPLVLPAKALTPTLIVLYPITPRK